VRIEKKFGISVRTTALLPLPTYRYAGFPAKVKTIYRLVKKETPLKMLHRNFYAIMR